MTQTNQHQLKSFCSGKQNERPEGRILQQNICFNSLAPKIFMTATSSMGFTPFSRDDMEMHLPTLRQFQFVIKLQSSVGEINN